MSQSMHTTSQFVAYGSIRPFSRVLCSLPYFFLVLLSLFRFAAPERRTLMPVLDSTDQIMPRSALHHRPLGDDAPKQEPGVSTGTPPVVQRASRLCPKQTDGEEEIKQWQR